MKRRDVLDSLLDHSLIFELVGGTVTFEKIVDVFYSKIEIDPILRPLFPHTLDAGKKRQALFLAQKFGGPREYEKLRGHARLRKRHFKFAIGIDERNRWVELMLTTLIEVGIARDHKAFATLQEYFERVATKMINKSEEYFQPIEHHSDDNPVNL